jgi:putative ABC transport system permease protein
VRGVPPGVRRALRLPSSRDRLARELDDEVRFHMEQRTAELVALGMSEPDARAEAMRRFGDTDDLKEYCQSIEVATMRRVRAREWWEGWTQDLRFALRQLRRAPGFAGIAIITLALGIGATTAIFSVVRGVLLRPLSYPGADRIVQAWQVTETSRQNQFSDANYDDLRAQSRSFAAIAELSAGGPVSVSGLPEAVRARASFVSRDFFDVLGVSPIRGRLFAPDELQLNGTPAVVVSHGFWQRNLGGSESAIGQKLVFVDRTFTVVGVMPATLQFPADVELWVPRELNEKFASRTAHNFQVVARLADGVTLDQARRDATAIARRLKQQHGDNTTMLDVALVPLQEQIVGKTKSTLMILLAGSLLLLLIACANVVNLLIARQAGRQAEIALRAALGAGRGRLAQLCLAESLMLSLTAGIVGIGIAIAGVKLLLLLQPGTLPRMHEVRVDWQVLAFAIGLASLAAVAMGIITAWRGSRGDLRDALSQSQRTQGGSLSSERVRRGLVVAQVAMAVVLLVAAGLFARSFIRLLDVNPGFRVEQQVVLDVTTGVRGPERIRMYDELLARLTAIPGVRHAGAVNVFPLTGASAGDGTFFIMRAVDERLSVDDFQRLSLDAERTGNAEFRTTSADYFKTMGIPVMAGRVFEDRDVATAPHVAVISASLAKTRWPNENPIGKVIQFGNMDGNLTPFTIVGVVGDVRETSLARDARPTFYATYRQRPNTAWQFNFVMATVGEPTATINAARRVVRDVNPDLPPRIRTIHTIVNNSVSDRRFVLSLVGVFGIAALVLAALGVYSVISYLVAQRGREISIRVALGARSEDILGMVIRQGVTLTFVGILVGAALALGAARVIEKMLFGVTATDPLAYAGVIFLLAVIAVLASWVPARRASRAQAMDVMRVG